MTNHAVSNRADLRERTKTMSRHGDRRGQIADFRDSFETINWLYLLFKCGIKTKTHFEWLLWHWSSLGQLNLEPTRPNGLVGCKVPTDLVKISVKEATHMGFHYTPRRHKSVPFVNIASLRSCSIKRRQWRHKLDYYGVVFAHLATGCGIKAKDPSGLDSDRWIPHSRCCENPARAKALAGFSRHLSAGFTDLNPAPRGLSL